MWDQVGCTDAVCRKAERGLPVWSVESLQVSRGTGRKGLGSTPGRVASPLAGMITPGHT